MAVPEKDAQIRYFEELLHKFGPTHRALDWNSAESQDHRFTAMLQSRFYGEPVKKPSVLDVGCGVGDLFGFLLKHPETFPDGFTYTGCDISPALVTAAREKYPEGSFEVQDILERPPQKKFDYVFACGVMTIRTAPSQQVHDQYVEALLKQMFQLSVRAVAVDFLSEWFLKSLPDTSWHKERYTYFEPSTILQMVNSLTRRVVLRHDYDPAEFCIYLLR